MSIGTPPPLAIMESGMPNAKRSKRGAKAIRIRLRIQKDDIAMPDLGQNPVHEQGALELAQGPVTFDGHLDNRGADIEIAALQADEEAVPEQVRIVNDDEEFIEIGMDLFSQTVEGLFVPVPQI